jgi:hypothetical protein
VSAQPKASRMEKQVKNLERGFLLAGVVLLMITMTMAGKFGWGLGHELPAQIGNATFFVIADFVGALLMSAVGLLFAWRWWGVGSLSVLAMVVCIGFSMASIFGFQSANRTAVSKNYDAQQKRGDDRLSWLRNSAIDKSLAKERQSFLAEERDQYNKLEKFEPDPDAQATELAKLLSIDKDQTQRGLNIIGAAFIIFLQFVCLSLRSFLRHRVAPAIQAWDTANSRQLTADKPGNSGISPSFSEGQARTDLDRLLSGGYTLDNFAFLARRWGWTNNKVGRWLRSQPDLNVAPPGRRGQRKSVARANGNGAHVMS